MSGICGIYSPDEPSLAGPDVLDRMLARLTPGRSERRAYVDGEAGLALGQAARPGFGPGGAGPPAWRRGNICVALDGSVYSAGQGSRQCGEDYLADAYRQSRQNFPAEVDGYCAFALWDPLTKRLLLANDSLGSRVFFYFAPPGRRLLVFATQLKALLAHPAVPREVSAAGLAFYLTRGYSAAPLTILQGVRKSLAAQVTTLEAGGECRTRCYWRPGPVEPEQGSLEEWAERVRCQMTRSVTRLCQGAERVGLLLSGGIDSSVALVALRQAGIAVEALTLVDPAEPQDGDWAALAANALKAPHHLLPVDAASLDLGAVRHVFRALDEPCDTASRAVTQYLLALQAREAGLDSCFDGHDSEFLFARSAEPRDAAAAPSSDVEVLADLYSRGHFLPPDEVRGLMAQTAPSVDEMASALGPPANTPVGLRAQQALGSETLYLRAPSSRYGIFSEVGTLAAGVQLRRAFREPELFELSRRIPPELKGLGSRDMSRAVLKQILREAVPGLLAREDKGAFPPLSHEGFFFERYAPLVSEVIERSKSHGLFRPQMVDKLLRKHARRQAARSLSRLWVLFVFQVWHEIFLQGRDPFAEAEDGLTPQGGTG